VIEQLEQEAIDAHDLPHFFKCAECREQVVASQDTEVAQVLWTDGACAHNQDYRFRRAGSGIFYDEGHDMNLSVFVPGHVQSNQRAELLAVVLACLRDPRPLDIRSDSEYVCNGFAARQAWSVTGWRGDHGDLWSLLDAEVRSRTSAVRVSWVKGHAKRIDVERGRTTEMDKRGNDGADLLAVAGAAMHRVSDELVESAQQRRCTAVRVQQMMVAVLKARLAAEADVVQLVDRGPDPGDGFGEVVDLLELDDDTDRGHDS